MTIINPVPFSKDLGEAYDHKSEDERNQYSHVLSETCSLVDRIFEDNASLQKSMFTKDAPTEFCFNKDDLWDEKFEAKDVIVCYKPMIEEHIERRVQFFFYQLIACYKTGLHFESIGAKDQGKSAEKIIQKVETAKGVTIFELVQRNACHSASNPCLVAFSLDDKKLHKKDLLQKGKGVVFLKDSDYYRMMNSTMSMPRWINIADREIDEKNRKGTLHEISLLRALAQDLINDVAGGMYKPDQALGTYLFLLKQQIQSALKRIEEDDPVYIVLKQYLKHTTLIQEYMASNPKIFEMLLGLKISDDSSAFKDAVFMMRYRAIREHFLVQGRIFTKIDNVAKTFLGKGRRLDHFTAAFRTLTIQKAEVFLDYYEDMPEDDALKEMDLNRQRLAKLFNFSIPNYKKQLSAMSKTKFSNTLKVLDDDPSIFEDLAQELIVTMSTLRKQDQAQIVQIIKELQKAKKWSDEDLDLRIKAVDERLSLETILASEFTKVTLKLLAEVFEINDTLFCPEFFYA